MKAHALTIPKRLDERNSVTAKFTWKLLVLATLTATIFRMDFADASSIALRFGPPSLGGGGTNPLSIPPQAMDMELVYVTSTNKEISFGLVPGILFGARMADRSGLYFSGGGGIIFNPDLATLGVYTAVGYSPACKAWCFEMEYKQSAGPYRGNLVTPYAVRAGAAYRF
jgi:hypothetical protein